MPAFQIERIVTPAKPRLDDTTHRLRNAVRPQARNLWFLRRNDHFRGHTRRKILCVLWDSIFKMPAKLKKYLPVQRRDWLTCPVISSIPVRRLLPSAVQYTPNEAGRAEDRVRLMVPIILSGCLPRLASRRLIFGSSHRTQGSRSTREASGKCISSALSSSKALWRPERTTFGRKRSTSTGAAPCSARRSLSAASETSETACIGLSPPHRCASAPIRTSRHEVLNWSLNHWAISSP